ncbi:hypothetical protein RB195_015059 [Necator americanus]|uniref:Uncharacterized protein n=1 Tax=Necator americanus TaxID=51031 RepID=A0ABR1E3B0_NECAM
MMTITEEGEFVLTLDLEILFINHCGPANVSKTTLLAFDHTIVRETCTTDCSENIDIKGLLSCQIGLNMAVFEASNQIPMAFGLDHT